MNRRRTVLVVAVAMVALAGCTGGGGSGTSGPTTDTTAPGETTPAVDASAAAIQSAALDATRNVSAYEATVNGTITVSANNVEQTIGLTNDLAVDRESVEYQRVLEQTLRSRTTTVEGYLLDGTNYVRSQATVQRYGSAWIEADAANETELFGQYDVLSQYRQALGNASVSVEGAVDAEETTLRELRAEPNATAMGEIVRTGNRSAVTDATVTYWIDREGRIHGLNATIDLRVETDRTTSERTTDVDVTFEYGEASIDLPEAASSAVDVTNETQGNGGDGPDDESDGTDESNDSGDDTGEGIAVRVGDLAVDPDRTFDRVERVLETDVTDPEAVVVEGPANLTRREGMDRQTLDRLLGLESASLTGTNVTLGDRSVPLAWLAEGRVDGVGNVYLHNASGMRADSARLLAAHEFVHYVQLQNDRFRQVNAATDATTDGIYARQATTEGAAVFTTDSLLERHAPDAPDGPRNTDLYEGIAAAVPNGSASQWRNSWYLLGERYVDARIDDPANLTAVYESPPTTSEQVIHRLAPEAEPPTPLTVQVETGSEYVLGGTDRKGEAYTRYVLENGLASDRAAGAAAGWGNDTAISFRPVDGEGNTGYVWIHRWDDADNATEFAEAAREYLGIVENGTTTLDGVPARFETLEDRTTVFVIGPQQFQDTVTFTLNRVNIVVETP